jgi:hypothetical protein
MLAQLVAQRLTQLTHAAADAAQSYPSVLAALPHVFDDPMLNWTTLYYSAGARHEPSTTQLRSRASARRGGAPTV